MKNVWIVGHHAVDAVLRTSPERALELYVVANSNNQAQQAIITQAKQHGLSICEIEKKALSKRCQNEQHQGVALVAKPKLEGNDKTLLSFVKQLISKQADKAPLLLLLDQVQDPHNFGACLRTADAAGVDAVVVVKDNASPLTPTVQKVACGAAQTMPIFRVTNLVRVIEQLKQQGIWVMGTSDKADGTLYQQDLSVPLAIVMGAEGKGLRQLTEKNCDTLLSLPMAGTVVSSLNVSVATGVCLYEVVRQRAS